VRRTAHGQGIELVTDDSLVDHLAEAGYRPEFGARELRRLIRSELETELARAILAGEVQEGDRVLASWDRDLGRVALRPERASAEARRGVLDEPASFAPAGAEGADVEAEDSEPAARRRDRDGGAEPAGPPPVH
jgi:ATP-dependent Clp protease ATP-binding subunit ClpC